MERETLRKVQLVQLEIAKDIKRVCEENNIQYFLDSGTLLGAVRHKGFIPWDDDLDVAMMRNEYERFIQIAPLKLDSKYELITWRNEPMYPNQFAKVIKRGTVYREETRHDDGKNGIYVDVFAYDNFPDDVKSRKRHGFKIMAYRAMIRAKCHTRMWTYQNHFYLNRWLKNIPFRFASIFYSKLMLIDKYEAEALKYNDLETELLFPQGSTKYGRWVIPKKCFSEYIEIQFEDTFFKAPVGYDEYLRYAYGDYMKLPPEDKRENRHSIVELSFGNQETNYDGKKYKVGYTCGVFDTFHVGHLNLLERCKEMCDVLIVGVCDDDYVVNVKKTTPVYSENDRKRILSSLSVVDRAEIVTIEETNDKMLALKRFHFNVLFSGDDWKGSDRYLMTEKQFAQYGVSIEYLPYTHGVSTSDIKRKLSREK